MASANGVECFSTRGERFADSGSELHGDLTQGIQDIFFSRGLRLLHVEDVSGFAVLCAKSNYVLATQACDRALQDRGTSRTLADLPCCLGSEWRIRRPAHKVKSLPDALLGNEAKNGDCASCTAMPWRSVPSKTESPVELAKSASTTVSLG